MIRKFDARHNTLGMTSEECADHSKSDRMKEAAAIQLPQGGAGTMKAFRLKEGLFVAGTVVEDDERTTD